jgi:replicative DNA helicase
MARPPRPQQNGNGTPVRHSLDAEMSVLGAVLLRPDAIRAISLSPLHFHDLRCKEVWDVMLWLQQREEPIDPLTLERELTRRGKLDACGGLPWLSQLAAVVPTADNVDHYARIVEEDARDRVIRKRLSEILHEQSQSPDELLDLVHGVLRAQDDQRALPARLPVVAAEAAREEFSKPLPPPIPTGFPSLDKLITGLRIGVYILTGGTGRGKTGFVLDMALYMSQQRPVLYLTEFDRRQAVARLAAKKAQMSWVAMYDKGPSETEMIAAYLEGHRLHPEEITGDTNLVDVLRRMEDRLGEPPILVLDYLQVLMREHSSDSFREGTSNVSAVIRDWARSRRAPALVVSSTSRAFYRGNSERTAGDFVSAGKESGDLEYDASGLLFLDTDPCPPNGTSAARLHLSKFRFGAGEQTICLTFHGAEGYFEPDDETAYVIDEERSVLRAVAAGEQEPMVISKLLRIPMARMHPIWAGLQGRGLLYRNEDGRFVTSVSV